MGKADRFSGIPGRVTGYPAQANSRATLALENRGNGNFVYVLIDEDGQRVEFSAIGNLQAIKDRQGIGWSISTTYSGADSTTRVTHTNGSSFTESRHPSIVNGMRVVNVDVADPAGQVSSYVREEPIASASQHPAFRFTLSELQRRLREHNCS